MARTRGGKRHIGQYRRRSQTSSSSGSQLHTVGGKSPSSSVSPGPVGASTSTARACRSGPSLPVPLPLPLSPTSGLQTPRLIQPAILHCFPFPDRLQLAAPRKPSPPSSPSMEMRRQSLTSPHRRFLQQSWQRQGEGSLAGMAEVPSRLSKRSSQSKEQRPHLATLSGVWQGRHRQALRRHMPTRRERTRKVQRARRAIQTRNGQKADELLRHRPGRLEARRPCLLVPKEAALGRSPAKASATAVVLLLLAAREAFRSRA